MLQVRSRQHETSDIKKPGHAGFFHKAENYDSEESFFSSAAGAGAGAAGLAAAALGGRPRFLGAAFGAAGLAAVVVIQSEWDGHRCCDSGSDHQWAQTEETMSAAGSCSVASTGASSCMMRWCTSRVRAGRMHYRFTAIRYVRVCRHGVLLANMVRCGVR